MSTHKQQTCHHCGVAYWFQGSGPGCHDKLNDSAYCPDCMAVIVEALKKVPKKVEGGHTDASTEVTREQLLAWEEEDKINGNNPFGLRRIGMPLFDLETGDSTCGRMIRGFWLSEWKKDPEYKIYKEVRVVIATGKIEGSDKFPVKPVVLLNPDKKKPKRKKAAPVGIIPLEPIKERRFDLIQRVMDIAAGQVKRAEASGAFEVLSADNSAAPIPEPEAPEGGE